MTCVVTTEAIVQANAGLLTKLSEEEQSHVLSYQVCQLFASLSEQGKDKGGATAASAVRAAPASGQPSSAALPAAAPQRS